MLSTTDFKPVTLADRDFFVKHYQRFPQSHSDNTFTNMVCWNDYAHYRYAYVEDCIVLSSTIAGMTRFRPPIGPHNPDLLREVMMLAAQSEEEHALRDPGPGDERLDGRALSGAGVSSAREGTLNMSIWQPNWQSCREKDFSPSGTS